MALRTLWSLGAVVLICALTLMPPVASAQTATSVAGNWEGTFTFMKDGKVMDTDPVHLKIKQEGTAVSGTGGPNADRQFPMEKVKYASAKGVTTLSFQVTAPNQLTIAFDLKLGDGTLKGTAVGTRDGETNNAVVELKLLK